MEKNRISSVLFIIGIIEMVVCFIVGFISGQPAESYGDFSIAIALYWWIGGFVSGMLFIGFSELLNLLQILADKSEQKNNIPNKMPSRVSIERITSDGTDLSEEDFTYNKMRLYLKNTLKSEGALVFSKKVLTFYKSEKSIFEIYISQIRSCEIMDEHNNDTLVNIIYEDNFGKLVKIGLNHTLHPNQIGNEIFNRVQLIIERRNSN